MADLSTSYLGINLKSPVVVGSSGLSSSLNNLRQMENNGAGAIVLKSIFEEEILHSILEKGGEASRNELLYYEHSETYDYFDIHSRNEDLDEYLSLIRKAKNEILIPVIGSINCVSDSEWESFALKIQEAGADAIELNLFFNPTGFTARNYEEISIRIIDKLLKTVTIPIAVKLSDQFANLGNVIQRISETGINGIVLFNRFYTIDFDLDKLAVSSADLYSNPREFVRPLRWVALAADRVKCSIAASGGIHSGEAALKQILAGADAVQVVSVLCKNGIDYIHILLGEMDKWLDENGYNSLEQIKGKLSFRNVKNPEAFERMQFMKYYGGLEQT